MHALHYANELLVRVRLSIQKSLNIQKQYENNVWQKSNDVYSLSIGVQTTMNHISIFTFLCFYDNINVRVMGSCQRQRKCFLSERELKKALRDILTRAAWLGPVIFHWFVLSMRMQVILDSSFAHPGSAPIWGGKKGEFRDWTMLILTLPFAHNHNSLRLVRKSDCKPL